MENSSQEYLKSFEPEILEVIVRISWFPEKGSSTFEMRDNCYKMRARFDQAINVKTGEYLGKDVSFNWLEWMAPKKKFGFNTGYRFKTGSLYRLLVRQKISGADDKFKVYYIEEVLEKNVKERRLDAVNQFESQFEEQTMQMLVLVKNRINGWVVENDYRKPATTFLAAIDSRTNELISEYGTLSWIEKNTKRGLRFNFDDMEIYHVSARKSKERDNFYLLENITRRGKDERLKQIREEYLKPVTIKTEFGNFLLDRKCNRFHGEINYLGKKSNVCFEIEEGASRADLQVEKLKEIYTNLTQWDRKVRKYAADEMLEDANKWCMEEEEEFTGEQFMEKLGVPSITIWEEGTIELSFYNDELFAGHFIIIEIDKHGRFTGINLEG